MTGDELGSESAESAGHGSRTERVVETAWFLLYTGVIVVGLSLLFTFELFVRF